MAQYIDKDALVAEIERRTDELWELLPDASKVENGSITTSEACNTGKYTALESFGRFINTLEVREVKDEPVSEDLEDAVNAYIGHKPDVDENSSVYGKRQAFKAGANWQKEQMMSNAIDVGVKVDAGGYPYIPQIELYDYDKDVPLAKAGEKVKVML